MEQIPPNPPPKKSDARRSSRITGDTHASLFSTGNHPVVGDPVAATRRTERGTRIAGDVKRALFFAVVLVFVAIVLYQFVSAF
jgi:hypothetical protein